MSEEMITLDAEALKLFESKGREGGPGIPQAGDANGVKVRRVMQITSDLAKQSFGSLRILDVACGEGVYAIEAALRGAEVLAIDGRTDRMEKGAEVASRHGIANLRFEQEDIRKVTRATHGAFDVIFFLGILYHLNTPDSFETLEKMYEMCEEFMIIDTHIAVKPHDSREYKGRLYEGSPRREHKEEDSQEARAKRLLMSLDNTFSFHFSKGSLFRLLHDVGFTSVLECIVPFEPYKPNHRITVVAMKGARVQIATYPWVNGKDEDSIEAALRPADQVSNQSSRSRSHLSFGRVIKRVVRALGYDIQQLKR